MLVSTTLTDATSAASPATLKGTVSAELAAPRVRRRALIPVENADDSCTVMALWESVLPVAVSRR